MSWSLGWSLTSSVWNAMSPGAAERGVGEHEPGVARGVGGGGVEEGRVPEHDVPGRAGEFGDPQPDAACLRSVVHQRRDPVLVAGGVPDLAEPRVLLRELVPHCARVRAGIRGGQAVGALDDQRAAAPRGDFAEVSEHPDSRQAGRGRRVEMPAAGRDLPVTVHGEGRQRASPAAGLPGPAAAEELVQGSADSVAADFGGSRSLRGVRTAT